MDITIITLFPEMFVGPFNFSIVARAQKKQLLTIHYVNLRDFATDNYGSVDDHPYGGGHGMILRVDVIDRAIQQAKRAVRGRCFVILTSPAGTPYRQSRAAELSAYHHLIFICGHYEGIDERVRDLVDEEISIGDFVLTGGELATMVMVDSIVRLLPGVLKKKEATVDESFSTDENILEYPQYTRPEIYKRKKVPEILLSGNHKEIANWRSQQARIRTRRLRPDLSKSD